MAQTLIEKVQDLTRYYLFPFFAITTLPIMLYFMLAWVTPVVQIDFSLSLKTLTILGLYSVYAYVFLFPYSQKLLTKGPLQVEGTVPLYNRNGMGFYLVTMLIQIILTLKYGNSVFLYLMDNHLLTYFLLNVIGTVFTIYLYLSGKARHAALKAKDKLHKNLEEPKLSNWLYQYYRGMDFHPQFFGVDVKQLTNCRFGLMIWQILVLGWATASYERFGLNYAVVVTTLLQTLYLCKFFYWEMGYFYTLDMILDRAGFYICWGCIVFVPAFYTFASYAICSSPPELNLFSALLFTVVGLASLVFNYWVDLQKQHFQQCNKTGKTCILWRKKAEFLAVKYEREGKMVDSKLLLSGFWGITRHMNYTFELMLAFCWCAVGYQTSILSLSYFGFLFLLLVSRCYRDETKCQKKYGKYWDEYCSKVKYRLIPYVY